jgi:hypothetical protein
MLIVGYCYGIRHERRLCEEVRLYPATRTMIERTRRRFNLNPKRLAADTAYGNSRFLAFITGAARIRSKLDC